MREGERGLLGPWRNIFASVTQSVPRQYLGPSASVSPSAALQRHRLLGRFFSSPQIVQDQVQGNFSKCKGILAPHKQALWKRLRSWCPHF